MSEFVYQQDANRVLNRCVSHGFGVRESPPSPRIITLVEPALRSRIDLVSYTSIAALHVDTLEAAHKLARDLVVGTLLISPSMVKEACTSELRSLLRASPGFAPFAVIGSSSVSSNLGLLQLGACGVRSVINVSEFRGLETLRFISGNDDLDVAAQILGTLLPVLMDGSAYARHFFSKLVRAAPRTSTIQAFAKQVHLKATTINSRFFRAGLPAPRTYLVRFRLLYVASFLTNPRETVPGVACRLGYSSPAALHRHIRLKCDITADELRALSFDGLLRDTAARLFVPYRQALCTFMSNNSL